MWNMQTNADINQSYFDLSLDYLTSDSMLEYLSGSQSTTPINEEFLSFICSIGARALFTMTDKSPSVAVSFRNTPKFFPFNDKTERLLRGLLTYLNQCIRNGSLSDDQRRVFIWVGNMLNIVSFIPYFVQTGYPTTILQWLSIEPKDTALDMRCCSELLNLLWNLVRHESAVQVLNQNQAIPILKTWKDRYLANVSSTIDEDGDDILIIYYMIYALLLDPVVFKQEDFTSIHLALDQMLNQTIQAFEKFVFQSNSSSCSKSCRREVIHADKRQKRMIPVYQGRQYVADDWFEIRAGSATWVRFGDRKSDDEVIETLIKLINASEKAKKQPNKISMHQKPDVEQNLTAPTVALTSPIVEVQSMAPLLPPNISLPTIISRKSIDQWTDEEVQQWLQLSPSTLHFSSGHALLAYANLVTHENAQHDEYERNLRSRGLSREQFANLISSLIHLRSSHNVSSSSTTPPEQWTRDEVKCWFEQNGLSAYLMRVLGFGGGIELITYARTLISSQMRIDDEYDRLRAEIKTFYNGQDLLQLSEYTRL
ncbi:unnamed protein product, partial [Rotaria sordida]